MEAVAFSVILEITVVLSSSSEMSLKRLLYNNWAELGGRLQGLVALQLPLQCGRKSRLTSPVWYRGR